MPTRARDQVAAAAGRARGSAARDLPAIAAGVCACTACPRLAAYVAGFRERPGYFARPVPGFGDPTARLLILGLAPGAHGANRTGRPFTGDAAGIFLYRALHEAGLASAPTATASDDGLALSGVFITNAVKCAPPQNKPLPAEARTCGSHLAAEMQSLTSVRAVLALGRTAHDAWLRHLATTTATKLTPRAFTFAHGAVHRPPVGPALIDSFHTSRYNVNVGKLTFPMFAAALATAWRAAQSLPVAAP